MQDEDGAKKVQFLLSVGGDVALIFLYIFFPL
jgi:hypothetical protein